MRLARGKVGVGAEAGARAGLGTWAEAGMVIGVGGCALVLLMNSSLVQGVAAAGQNILRALAFACEGRVRLSVVFGLSVVVGPNTHRTRP